MNIKIPTKHYKVLLVQLMIRFTESLMVTFKGANSIRHSLASDVHTALLKLERELKRNVTLQEASIAKKKMFDCLYAGRIPDWFENVFKEALREENVKLESRREQQEKQREIQEFFKEKPDQVNVSDQVIDPNKKLEDAEKGDVWYDVSDWDNNPDDTFVVWLLAHSSTHGMWVDRDTDNLDVDEDESIEPLESLKHLSDNGLQYVGNILKGNVRLPVDV